MSHGGNDNLAPKNKQAEQAVLGSVMINPECLPTVRHMLSPDDFYDGGHAAMWEAICNIEETGIDFVLIVSELERLGKLHLMGGAAGVLHLVNETPNSLNVEGYAKPVKDAAYRRRLLEFCSQSARLAHSEETDIREIHDAISDELSALGGGLLTNPVTARELSNNYLDKLLLAKSGVEVMNWYSTGFRGLDRMLGHTFGPASFTALGGYTSGGKSWIACQIALALAAQGVPVLFVSLESAPERIHQRMTALTAGVNYTKVQTLRDVTDDEYSQLIAAQDELAKLPLEIDVLESLGEIEARANALSVRYGYLRPAVIIDDLDSLAGNVSEEGEYQRLLKLIPKVLTMALKNSYCVFATKQLKIPRNIDASMSDGVLHEKLNPHISSYQGGATIIQKAGTGLVMWGSDWIRQKVKPEFDSLKMTRGVVYIRRLRSRDDSSEMVDEIPLTWNPAIPCFENIELETYDTDAY